jgi:hypothetical protein
MQLLARKQAEAREAMLAQSLTSRPSLVDETGMTVDLTAEYTPEVSASCFARRFSMRPVVACVRFSSSCLD